MATLFRFLLILIGRANVIPGMPSTHITMGHPHISPCYYYCLVGEKRLFWVAKLGAGYIILFFVNAL